ncbi:hypothetical protein AB0D57_14760 [Streptomyces sp. NPDC048275]|uniref:hypothetical protein n=1 Tax=Streptomyces sp. NPDC048275 TaxID=3155629 RepID=UPI0033ECCFC1
MRIRTTIAAVTAVLAVTLVGYGSEDKAEPTKSSSPKATQSVDHSEAEKAAGIPAEPDAATRTALVEVLKAINRS